MRILYWGVHDRSYPRNERLRSFLEDRLRADVTIVDQPRSGSRLQRVSHQVRAAFRVPRNYSIVILSEFSLLYAIAAKVAAIRSRAPLVVDFFVGLEETEIGDFQEHSSRSMRAATLRFVDRLATRLADLCLTDTDVRAARFESKYGRPFVALPVGAPSWARDVQLREPEIDVLYYGSYLPLHDVPLLVRSISLLPPNGLPSVFVGDGPTRRQTEALVDELGLRERVQFVGPLSVTELRRRLEVTSVAAGVFGTSDKAREVVANKVWQSLSAGVPTVTRASPALKPFADFAVNHLITVDDLNPEVLAAALGSGRRPTAGPDNAGVASGAALEAFVSDRYELFGETVLALIRKLGRR